MMELIAWLPRTWFPIVTGLAGGAFILFVFKKTLAKLLYTCDSIKDNEDELSVDEEPYIKALAAILIPGEDVPFVKGPTKLLDFLYIGSEHEAKQVKNLQALGITHVINCVDGYIGGEPSRVALYKDVGIQYLNFLAQDRHSYVIMKHVPAVFKFIEQARTSGGKALIHCSMGINRSGALAAAYIMVFKQWGPLSTAIFIREAGRTVLLNSSFQAQLVLFGGERGLLECDGQLLLHSQSSERAERARESLCEKVRGLTDQKMKTLFGNDLSK